MAGQRGPGTPVAADLRSLRRRQRRRLHDKLERGFWRLGFTSALAPGSLELLDELDELLRELEGLKPFKPGRWREVV